jgi:uncharacterized protein (DUF1778 family)
MEVDMDIYAEVQEKDHYMNTRMRTKDRSIIEQAAKKAGVSLAFMLRQGALILAEQILEEKRKANGTS